MRRYIYKKIYYLTFELDFEVMVTQSVAQHPLRYVTYTAIKFKIATANGLGGDTFARNVTDGPTDRWTNGWTDGRTDEQATD